MEPPETCALVYETFVQAVACEPTEEAIKKMLTISRMLDLEPPVNLFGNAGAPSKIDGRSESSDAACDKSTWRHSFHERLVVPSAPRYIPASESYLRGAYRDDTGTWTFSPGDGKHMSHVVECYRSFDFDYRRLNGYPLLIDTIRPDHIAAELSFVAYLRGLEAKGGPAADSAGAYADAFLGAHPATWTHQLALCSHDGAEDYYSLVFDALDRWIGFDLEGDAA